MKNPLIIIFIAFNINSYGADLLYIVTKGKIQYAATSLNIWEIKKTKLTSIYESKEAIIAFVPLGQKILFCTSKSVGMLKKDNNVTIINHHLTKPEFVSICTNPNGSIYIATRFDGVFTLEGDSLKSFYKAYPVNTIKSTNDSSLWVGTDIGLHKIKNNQITIFKEEGVSNFEIADNHIDKLILDNLGDMWVKMTEDVSVITVNKKAEHHEHLPTIKFIGSPDNSLYSVTFHEKLGYLFSTKEGLLLMPLGKKDDNHKYFELAEEIAQEGPNTNLGVLKRVYYENTPLQSNFHVFIANNVILLAKPDGLIKINTKKLAFK